MLSASDTRSYTLTQLAEHASRKHLEKDDAIIGALPLHQTLPLLTQILEYGVRPTEATNMHVRVTRRVTTMAIASVALVALSTASALAQSAGSGGGSFSNAFLIPTVVCSAGSFDPSTLTCDKPGGGAKVLFGNIKTPSAANKNVLVMATLESSILTNTVVASKNGGPSTSTASGTVIVTPKVYLCPNNDCTGASGALVDITTMGGSVTPNQVTFNQRTQTLTASLQGLNCTLNTLGVLTCTDPETIGLLISTMSANGFNFLVQTPGQGVYQVQLGIALEASASTTSLPAGAQATVGVGAGSLVEMIVQAQTPFDTIKVCNGGPQTGTGGPANCGPQ